MSPLVQMGSGLSARALGLFGSGAAASSFESIATATSSGSTSTITFSSIPSTYKHLQIRAIARMAGSIGNTLFMQANSTTDYTYHYLRGNGSGVAAGAGVTNTYAQFMPLPSSGLTANAFGVFIIDILDYASTSKKKTIRAFSGLDLNGTTDSQVHLTSSLAVGLANSAITTLTFKTEDLGNFASGTQFALYGIKGS